MDNIMDIFKSIRYVIIYVSNLLISYLPDSPFTSFLNGLESIPELGYLNWFFPIKEMIVIGEAWLACIIVFYLYMGLMRFVQLIE